MLNSITLELREESVHNLNETTRVKQDWVKPELLFDGDLQDTIQAKQYLPGGDPGHTDQKPPGDTATT